MKNKLILILFIIVAVSCDNYEPLPPKVNSITDEYLLPQGTILTQDERALVEEQWDEYDLWLLNL